MTYFGKPQKGSSIEPFCLSTVEAAYSEAHKVQGREKSANAAEVALNKAVMEAIHAKKPVGIEDYHKAMTFLFKKNEPALRGDFLEEKILERIEFQAEDGATPIPIKFWMGVSEYVLSLIEKTPWPPKDEET